jgi:nucleoside-diphosphate-sugar epimerase
MADIVVLTGITGFLGGHLARELLASGYHVRGSLRNPARADDVRKALWDAGEDISRLEFVTLNLNSDAGWDEAMAGARFLMHSASPFVTTMPKDKGELIRPAVDGTARAMGAALRAGVERVVLTSSTAAVVYGRGKGGPARLGPDDWSPIEACRMTAYTESKLLAERKAWEMVKGQEARLAVINPGLILGPLLDDDPGTSGALVQRFLQGSIPMAPDLTMHCVDVRDLARIHVAALTDPQAAGQRHIAAFDEATILRMGQLIAEARPDYARKMPKWRMPDWLTRAYALFDGDMRANLVELGYRPKLDTTGARRLLGRPPRSAGEAVGAMADSLIARGLV